MSLSKLPSECVCVHVPDITTPVGGRYINTTGRSRNGPSLFLAGGWGHF